MIVWEDQVQHMHLPKQRYLIEPIVPVSSVVLLHGDAGIGKSPLSWALANAVSSGTNIFGLPTTQTHVLYLETDTPAPVVLARLQGANFHNHFTFLFVDTNLDVLGMGWLKSKAYQEIEQAKQGLLLNVNGEYGLVVVNTLRKVHSEEDTKSHVPNLVYKKFQEAFPRAAILFVHHDRKSSQYDGMLPAGDKASGSKHWVNDCQVQLHLTGTPQALKLEQLKNQGGPPIRPIYLRLESDGVTLTERSGARIQV